MRILNGDMFSKTLYLIDGSSYIFRAYYAIRHLSTSRGFPTNAVYGFTSMILKFIKDYEPDYIAMVFDSADRTFRHDIYPLYKANRDSPPSDLVPQFDKIYEMVEAFSIPLVQLKGYEADDLIGTIAKKNEDKEIDIVLVTGDKDFCQLVSDRIKMLDTMKDRVTDRDEVLKRFGVDPDQVTDVLALSGDQVDNVPGVRGIGEKTASKLIKEFGSLDGLYEQIDLVKGKQRNNLIEDKDHAFLSKRLVTIDTDVDIETGYEKFRYSGFNSEKLLALFDEFEFRNLKSGLTGGGASEENDDVRPDSSSYRLVLSEDVLSEVIEKIHGTKELSIDLWTTSRWPTFAEMIGISLTPAPGEGFYIPLAHKGDVEQLSMELVLSRLKPVLEDSTVRKIGQNLKYKIIVLHGYGINLDGIFFDTMLAAHLLDSSRQNYQLDRLSQVFLDRAMSVYKDTVKKDKAELGFADMDTGDAKDHSCENADVSMKLYKVLRDRLAESDLEYTFSEKVIKLVPVLAKVEMNGVLIREDVLKTLSQEFSDDLERITDLIYCSAGEEFNIKSPVQLRNILFGKLKLEVKKKTKKGEPSTDHEVLVDLSTRHELPSLILRYREVAKLKSTYVDSLPRLINPRTGRLHTSYNSVGTATGRLSSSDPNLQNIPVKSAEGRKIREAFVPAQGHVFLSADYSQIELRLLAHFSQDEKLIEAFINDSDIHARTASEILSVDEDMVTKDMRRLAKNINFGIIYGISPFGLSKQIGTGVFEAKKYMGMYFSRYPGVRHYLDASLEEAKSCGYAVTIIGRRRLISGLDSKNRVQRGIAERAAINTPIQGSAADIINLAMINIDREITSSDCKMILQVHDELIFEIKEEAVQDLRQKIKEEMENAYKLSVPVKVEMGQGSNWADT